MADERDNDETRALIGELHEALGGEPDMTAASGLGPRDRGHDDDVIAGGSGRGDAVRGGGGGGRSTATASGAAPSAPTTRPAPSAAASGGGKSAGGRSLGPIIAALLVGLIVGGGLAALLLGGDDSAGDDFGGTLDSSRYQAVILSNDKVYFGQLESVSDTYYELDNAFFLRETRESPEAEPRRALLPVNREIHAPDNTMLIRKDEVVLVENLAEDSPILAEIKRQKG